MPSAYMMMKLVADAMRRAAFFRLYYDIDDAEMIIDAEPAFCDFF